MNWVFHTRHGFIPNHVHSEGMATAIGSQIPITLMPSTLSPKPIALMLSSLLPSIRRVLGIDLQQRSVEVYIEPPLVAVDECGKSEHRKSIEKVRSD